MPKAIRIGAGDLLHGPIGRCVAGADANGADANHTPIRRHLDVIGEPSAVAGTADTNDTHAMLLSFVDRQFHGVMGNQLADVMVSVYQPCSTIKAGRCSPGRRSSGALTMAESLRLSDKIVMFCSMSNRPSLSRQAQRLISKVSN